MHYERDHNGLTFYNDVKIQNQSSDHTGIVGRPSVKLSRKPIPRASFETEHFFRTIFKNRAIGMAIITRKGEIARANRTFQNIVGYSDSELPFMTFQEFTHQDDVDKEVNRYEQLLSGKIDDFEMEKRFICKDGCARWVHLSVSLMPDPMTSEVFGIALVRDIDQKKRAEIELQVSNYRLTKAFKGANEAIWHWLDVNGEDEWWSPGFYQILGYTESDLTPNFSNFLSLLHPADHINVKKAIVAHLDDDTPFDVEYRLKTKSGHYKWIQAKGIAERDESGRATEMIGIIADIDHIKRSEKTLHLRNVALENSNRELESFAYVASHDLQEPLRTINSFLGLFQESVEATINDEAQEYLDIANQATLRMRQLLDDLLVYSRVGTREMEYGLVEIPDLLSEVASDLSTILSESGGQIDIRSIHSVHGDSNKLYRLFSNLISNSLKFRAQDVSPIISIESDETEDRVIFKISDNGIGISQDHQDTVFKIFRRLHTRDEYPGSGIGLSVCKKIVELHHGKIWFESSEDSGTTFIIELPKHE